MGKEQSKTSLPEIEGDAIEVTTSYVLHVGKLQNNNCSIFSGAPSKELSRLASNLKTHRHPSILKYVSSGEHDGRLYLATEPVQPLFLVLDKLSTLQICVGLHSIISALTFLHSKAQSSHNNVCCASIFVTSDGIWKLGGLEFMTKFLSTTSLTLQETVGKRYEHCIPPEERSGRIIPDMIDVFALGVLLNELFQRFTEYSELPSLSEVLNFSKNKMAEPDPRARASLSEVASHPFFCHDFIRIQKFLSELPLKLPEEKAEFFRELEHQLRGLPEDMVCSQLLPLLLARVVVLEPTAQLNLIPAILRPKTDSLQDGALFSESCFKLYVVPKLLQMFCVRDVFVRLLLLTHLHSFIHCFTKEQLQAQLLPELLVGVKDENDELVAATLHALASLVGVLGGSAVVGKHRARLFSDGRPATRRPRPDVGTALPERPSPDGGEDSIAEDTEAWSDWEQPSENVENGPVADDKIVETAVDPAKRLSVTNITKPVTLADIDSLDIKSGNGWKSSGPDFFTDMEPVICPTQVAPVFTKDKFGVSEAGTTGDAWDSFEDWTEDKNINSV